MQLRRTAQDSNQVALQTVAGETGCAAIGLIAVATGLGLLLDFQFTNLHPVFSVALLILSVPVSMYWTIGRTLRMGRKPPSTDYVRNLALASVAGQAGCVSVVLIFMALFAGIFLDSRLDTHPVFTIGLVLISVPLSLYAMIRLMLSSVGAIKMPAADESPRTPPASSLERADQSHKENGS